MYKEILAIFWKVLKLILVSALAFYVLFALIHLMVAQPFGSWELARGGGYYFTAIIYDGDTIMVNEADSISISGSIKNANTWPLITRNGEKAFDCLSYKDDKPVKVYCAYEDINSPEGIYEFHDLPYGKALYVRVKTQNKGGEVIKISRTLKYWCTIPTN